MNKPFSQAHDSIALRARRPLTLTLLPMALAFAAAGCNVDSSVPASVNAAGSDSMTVGSVAGQDLVVHEAIAFRVDGGDTHGVAVVLTDRPGACAALQHGAALATATTLSLFVPDTASSAPTGAGYEKARSIDWPPSDQATHAPEATFTTRGVQCEIANGDSVGASRGRIELDNVALSKGARSLGSFDLGFGSDAIVGKFAAVDCDFVATSSDPFAGAEVCQ